ncbi:MAG TPA: hypothetical protein VE422_01595 [Terriglobia bacterium]|nr:hypothetical protein [Terriglobia bacterium]
MPTRLRRVLFVFADRFDQVLVWKKIQTCQGDRPGSGISLRVVDSDLQIDVPEAGAPEAFGDVRRFGLGVPVHVQPPFIIKADGFDDQRVALPLGVVEGGKIPYQEWATNHLAYEALIEDTKVFTRPWKISMPLYRRLEKNMQLLEFKCVEYTEELLWGPYRKQPSDYRDLLAHSLVRIRTV